MWCDEIGEFMIVSDYDYLKKILLVFVYEVVVVSELFYMLFLLVELGNDVFLKWED